MNPAMNKRSAFTLIELIIALVLSTFLLVAIVGMTSQMLRYEIEGSRKATSTNWSLMSLDSMKKEVAAASVLYCPSIIDHTSYSPDCTKGSAKMLSGCSNYTLNPPPGALDSTKNTVAFHYCVWDAASTPTKTPWLLHYRKESVGETCPLTPIPTCGTTPGFDVVAQDFYLSAGNNWYFKKDESSIGGVEIQFMVGIGTSSVTGLPNAAVPTAQHIRTLMSMNKSYGNTLD